MNIRDGARNNFESKFTTAFKCKKGIGDNVSKY